MHSRLFLVVLSLFLLFILVSADKSTATVAPSTLPVIVESSTDILPLSVSVRKPLRDIEVSYSAAENVRVDQRSKYAQLTNRFLKSSDAERPLLKAQISQQRQRVLLSTLNSMVLIYQRADYLVEKFNAGLLRMRSKYKSSGVQVPSFDSRVRALHSSLASLKRQSAVISKELSSASSSVELSRDLIAAKQDLASFLNNLESFSSDYRSLAQDIVSRK